MLLAPGWLTAPCNQCSTQFIHPTTKNTSNKFINQIYQTAIENGALGGKLLGAGGGGFLLLYVEPQNQKVVAEKLSDLYQLPFGFGNVGSQITYYDQSLD